MFKTRNHRKRSDYFKTIMKDSEHKKDNEKKE